MVKLQWPDRPSPFWFGRCGPVFDGIVAADGHIHAQGDVLSVVLDGMVPPVGTAVLIEWTKSHLVAETVAERHERCERERCEREEEVEARRQADTLRERELRARKRQRAESVNGGLKVPVRWTSGRKIVLSGLSANGWGDGANARTVTHILLLEPIAEGRFTRPAQSFLCTSAKGSDGKDWTDSRSTSSEAEDGRYVSEINCQQCLKLARRWDAREHGMAPELM